MNDEELAEQMLRQQLEAAGLDRKERERVIEQIEEGVGVDE